MKKIFVFLLIIASSQAMAEGTKNIASVVIIPAPEKKIIINGKPLDINSIEEVQIKKTNDSIEIIFE